MFREEYVTKKLDEVNKRYIAEKQIVAEFIGPKRKVLFDGFGTVKIEYSTPLATDTKQHSWEINHEVAPENGISKTINLYYPSKKGKGFDFQSEELSLESITLKEVVEHIYLKPEELESEIYHLDDKQVVL